MRRVAVNAAYLVLPVERIRAIEVSWPGSMAGEAARIDFLRGMLREDENLRLVTTAFDVSGSRAMAPLASLMRRAASRVESCLPVRSFLPAVIDVFVASLANFRTHILSLVGVLRSGRSPLRRFRTALRRLSFLRPSGRVLQENETKGHNRHPAETLPALHWTLPQFTSMDFKRLRTAFRLKSIQPDPAFCCDLHHSTENKLRCPYKALLIVI